MTQKRRSAPSGADDRRPERRDETDRLRPFEGVRISKGTDRARGWRALVGMFRTHSGSGTDKDSENV